MNVVSGILRILKFKLLLIKPYKTLGRVKSKIAFFQFCSKKFTLELIWWHFLEHILKKMGRTEIVVSSVRPAVRLSPNSQPLWHLESWNFQHKSVALQWSIVRSGIWGPWPRSPGIWPWPGPLTKKYTSTSITRVPVVQIEQMRAHLKGFSARIVMSSESMVTWPSGLLPNPAKVPFFQYKAWWYSIVQKFHNEGKKIQDSQFLAHFGLRPWSGLSLSFYCPVTDQQPKNVFPIFVVTRNFLFIW
jgi:hypothetical protein